MVLGQWLHDASVIINYFKNTQEANTGVRLASDATAEVTVTGDVDITVTNGVHDRSIRLQKTLHVSCLRTNLLLVANIVDTHHQVSPTKEHAHVKDKDGNTKMIAD